MSCPVFRRAGSHPPPSSFGKRLSWESGWLQASAEKAWSREPISACQSWSVLAVCRDVRSTLLGKERMVAGSCHSLSSWVTRDTLPGSPSLAGGSWFASLRLTQQTPAFSSPQYIPVLGLSWWVQTSPTLPNCHLGSRHRGPRWEHEELLMTLQSWRSRGEKQKYLEDKAVELKGIPEWGLSSTTHHDRPRLLPSTGTSQTVNCIDPVGPLPATGSTQSEIASCGWVYSWWHWPRPPSPLLATAWVRCAQSLRPWPQLEGSGNAFLQQADGPPILSSALEPPPATQSRSVWHWALVCELGPREDPNAKQEEEEDQLLDLLNSQDSSSLYTFPSSLNISTHPHYWRLPANTQAMC